MSEEISTPRPWRAVSGSAKEAQIVSDYGGETHLVCMTALKADAELIVSAVNGSELSTLRAQNAVLVEALKKIEAAWVSNNSEGDDFDEGFDLGLEVACDITLNALAQVAK